MLISTTLHQNRRMLTMKYIMMAGMLLLGIIVVMSFNAYAYTEATYSSDYYSYIDPAWDEMNMLFVASLIFFGAFSAIEIFAPMSSKGKRLVELMLPATRLEKYCARFIIYIVLFAIAFTLTFGILDIVRVVATNACFPRSEAHIGTMIEMMGVRSYFSYRTFAAIILTAFTIIGVYAVGASFHPKNAIVVTTVAGGLLLVVASLYLSFINDLLINSNQSYYHTDGSISRFIGYTTETLTMLYLYWLAYYRFKQSEIINRF